MSWPRQVWLIRPDQADERHLSIESAVVSAVASAGLSLGSLRAIRLKAKGVGAVTILRPADVERLYRSIHRSLALVVTTSSVRIQRRMNEAPTVKGSIPIDRFLRYKALHRLITKPAEVDTAFSDFASWCTRSTNIKTAFDPRMLPSITFDYRCDPDVDLDQSDGMKRFLRDHGTPWTDHAGSVWAKANDPHTIDTLHIGGETIPIGLHWDVQLAKPRLLHNGWEDWELPGHVHANVHPDGHVRSNKGRRLGPRFWQEGGGQGAPRKTPRERRRGGR